MVALPLRDHYMSHSPPQTAHAAQKRGLQGEALHMELRTSTGGSVMVAKGEEIDAGL